MAWSKAQAWVEDRAEVARAWAEVGLAAAAAKECAARARAVVAWAGAPEWVLAEAWAAVVAWAGVEAGAVA